MSPPAQIRVLSQELQKIAYEQLNEESCNISAELQSIKTWLLTQGHLKSRTDDQFLLSFLRSCKHNLLQAQQKIDNFYTLRSKYSQFYGLNEDSFERALQLIKDGVFCIPPQPMQTTLSRLVLIRLAAIDISQFDIFDFLRAYILLNEIFMWEDDNAGIAKIRMIFDLSNAPPEQIAQMPTLYWKCSMVWVKYMMVCPINEFHYINMPAAYNHMIDYIRSLYPEHIPHQFQLFVHATLQHLYKQIAAVNLPQEYGGNNGSFSQTIAEWTQRAEAYRNYFREEAQYCVNEALRQHEAIDFAAMLQTN